MGDVHGGLLKCVLQLAACSDKLRTTDALLGSMVAAVQRDLPLAEMPALKATLAVVPVSASAGDAHAKRQQFDDALAKGTEAAERLEMTKARLEKELRRRSDDFREIVSSRNTDIQEEYERMLQELEDQADALSKDIEAEKRKKRSTRKRRAEHATRAAERRKRSRGEAESERRVLMQEIAEHSSEVRQLQSEFAQLEQQLAHEADDERANERQSAADRQAVAEARLRSEVSELRQEIALLRETQEAIAEAQQTSSLKAQYEDELQGVEDEAAHLQSAHDETVAELSANGARLHSLLRTLAPSASIGTLMTRLHQQLAQDTSAASASSSTSTSPTPAVRKTVELQAFLSSCPSAEEGRRAIDEMKKLRLIYCYESSGIVALAD